MDFHVVIMLVFTCIIGKCALSSKLSCDKAITGSKEKLMTVYKLSLTFNKKRRFADWCESVAPYKKHDVYLNLMKLDKREIGVPVRISVQLVNRASKDRTVRLAVGAQSMKNISQLKHTLDFPCPEGKEDHLCVKTIELGPNESEIFTTTIPPEDYVKKLSSPDKGVVKISGFGVVKETNQVWTKDYYVIIAKDMSLFKTVTDLYESITLGR